MKVKTFKWLVVQFVGWAMDNGCYRNEDGEIENYFTIAQGKKGKPCFKKSFQKYKHNWPQVRQAAYEDGVLLGYTPPHGWFIGNEADMGKYLAMQHKSNETRIANLDDEISYLMFIGDDQKISQVLSAYNSKREKELRFDQVQKAIREFHLAMGIPYQEHVVSLLNAPIEDGDDTK